MSRRVILSSSPLSAAKAFVPQNADAPNPFSVVVPNRRAAAYFNIPYRGLSSLAVDQLPGNHGRLASELDAKRALRRVANNPCTDACDSCDVEARLRNVAGDSRAAAWIHPALTLFLHTGLDLASLAASNPVVGSGRAAKLARIALRYLKILDGLQQTDPAASLRQCLEHWDANGAQPSPKPLLVAGFPSLDGDQREFVDAFAPDGSVVVLNVRLSSSTALVPWFAARGWTVERDEREAATPGDRLSARWAYGDGATQPGDALWWNYPNDRAAIYGALTEIKRLIVDEKVPMGDIALVVRTEADLGDAILTAARELDVPVHLSHNITARDTRLGAWLAAGVDAWRTDLPYEATLRWLGVRWAQIYAVIDEPRARRERPIGVDRWQSTGAPAQLLALPPDGAPVSEWILWLRGALADAVAASRDDPRDVAAQLELTQVMDEEAAKNDSWTRQKAIAEVSDWLDDITVEAQPGRGGVALHSPVSLHGGVYRHVVVLGANDGRLPKPIEDDSYLDFYEREAVNAWIAAQHPDLSPVELAAWQLDTASQFSTREIDEFVNLLPAVQDRLLFCVASTVDNREARPSLFVRRLCDAPTAPPAQLASRLVWQQRALRNPACTTIHVAPYVVPSPHAASATHADRAAVDDELTANERLAQENAGREAAAAVRTALSAARRAHAVELRRDGPEPADKFDGALGMQAGSPALHQPRRFSVSALVALGQCPFRYFAARGLGLAELEETEPTPDPRLRGGAWHRAAQLALLAAQKLGCLYDVAARQRLIALGLDAAVNAPLDESNPEAQAVLAAKTATASAPRGQCVADDEDAERADFSGRLPNWPRIRAEWLSALQWAVAQDAFLPQNHEPAEFEVDFAGEWQGLPVHGIIDRVDRLPNGGVALVDYKAGQSTYDNVPDADGKLNVDLQLPLYHHVFAQQRRVPVEEAGYLLGMGKWKKESPPKDENVLANFVEQVQERFAQGNFEVAPDAARQACCFCQYDSLCRRGPRLDRKRKAKADEEGEQ